MGAEVEFESRAGTEPGTEYISEGLWGEHKSMEKRENTGRKRGSASAAATKNAAVGGRVERKLGELGWDWEG